MKQKFIAQKRPTTYFTEHYYSRKKKSIEVAVAIDYQKAFNASRPALIKMMEKAYLEGIDMIGTRIKNDFDLAQFKKDVEAIFVVDKWYELAMEPSH